MAVGKGIGEVPGAAPEVVPGAFRSSELGRGSRREYLVRLAEPRPGWPR